jgi:hypothetical protein
MTEHRPEQQYHDRKRSLTEADINDLLDALDKRREIEKEKEVVEHSCRFGKVTEEDFYASVEFFKSMNAGLTSGKIIAAKTVLVLLVTFLCGVIGAGLFSKFKVQ